jgi:hypothetical protein
MAWPRQSARAESGGAAEATCRLNTSFLQARRFFTDYTTEPPAFFSARKQNAPCRRGNADTTLNQFAFSRRQTWLSQPYQISSFPLKRNQPPNRCANCVFSGVDAVPITVMDVGVDFPECPNCGAGALWVKVSRDA